MKTVRNGLIALVLGFGLGFGAVATADGGKKGCTVDCQAQERACIDDCAEWGDDEARVTKCEASCKKKAQVCDGKCKTDDD